MSKIDKTRGKEAAPQPARAQTRDAVYGVLSLTPADEALLERGFIAVAKADYEDPENPLSPREILLREAVKRDPAGALSPEGIYEYKKEPYAVEVLEIAAKAKPEVATNSDSLEAYLDLPDAERIYKEALTALGKGSQDGLSTQGFLTRLGDAKILDLDDERIEKYCVCVVRKLKQQLSSIMRN